MAQSFDVVVIGAGPGGYIAAIRAAQLGFSTACIDEWKNDKGGPAPGGTCTNVGCIPSKALLQSSEHYDHAGRHFAEHGIQVKGLGLDLPTMIARKQAVVKQNNDGILYLFKKNKVAFFHGRGSFAGAATADGYAISVAGAKPDTLTAKHVIVATGSTPRALPGAPFDEKLVLSNDGALAMQEVPKSLGLIGAGVIGLEMGSVWRRLGSDVTILEALPSFLGAADEQIAKEAQKAFAKQSLNVQLGVKIDEVKAGKNVTVKYTSADGKAQTASFDKLIVSIGRVPNTAGLNHAAAGLKLDERGFVVVDGDCRSNLANVWAVGDVVRGPMLAHKAEEEGVAVAERIAGQKPHVDFNTIPWVIYTSPEIAWVGQTEQALKASGRAYKAGSFPFAANGRARALGDTTGMVKILADAKSDEILGVHIVGPMASELIAEAVVAMEFRASAEDIARICHAHPTLSEATKEAALAVDKRTLNM
jgi:dihydrolipoamide dehydrogenase